MNFSSLAVCVFFLSVSCAKFLDKKSDDSLRELVDLSDFQAALDVHNAMNETSLVNLSENVSDHYFLTDATFNGMSEDYRGFYTWTYLEYLYPNDWADYYRLVGRANLVLEGLQKIPRTNANSKQWDEIKGSALFFRSFAFLNLAWTFAKAYDEQSYERDLGIALRTNTNFNDFFDRANVKDTYARIIEDLTHAVGLMPDHPIHVFRPSNRAVHALLARAYLSMRRYDMALEHANESLAIYDELLDFETELPNVKATMPFPQYNKEVMFYFETNILFGYFSSGAQVDTLLYQQFEANDLRKSAYFAPSGDYHRFKPNYASKENKTFTGLATDELYLIRAECLARLNDEDGARQTLSSLLSHRYTGADRVDVNERGETLLNRILLERKKELLNRGIRWSDIKRLNKEGSKITIKRKIGTETYELTPNHDRFALPIPSDIVKAFGMKQNPQ